MILKALEKAVSGLAHRPVDQTGGAASTAREGTCPLLPECPLTGLGNGELFEITELLLDEKQAQRLRELGMREGATCGMVLNNGKLIVCVHDCRIAMRREVGDSIRGRRMSDRAANEHI